MIIIVNPLDVCSEPMIIIVNPLDVCSESMIIIVNPLDDFIESEALLDDRGRDILRVSNQLMTHIIILSMSGHIIL